MSLYRCAMCGSSKIVLETKKEGYSKKKGILGVALFGSVGAWAGASGNAVTYYHCGDCGAVLNRVMSAIEKESIDRCLARPDIYQSSLKSYKNLYKNIEWEEEQVIPQGERSVKKSKKIEVFEIEDRIIEYMRKVGVPVSGEQISKSVRLGFGLDDEDVYEGAYRNFFDDYDVAFDNLMSRGLITVEYIGGDFFWILVTDIEEMKELALKDQAQKRAKEFVHANKCSSLLKTIPSQDFMTASEIYDYLKQNNYLPEQVVEEEKKNLFFPDFFIWKCIDAWKAEYKRPPYSVLENGKYKMLGAEEMEKIVKEREMERNEAFLAIFNEFKSIVSILKNYGKPCRLGELESKFNNKRFHSYLRILIQAEIVVRTEERKLAHFSVANIPQEEIDKKLYEIASQNFYSLSGWGWEK